MSDFQGALLGVGEGRTVQILEIVLGANENWHLTAAYLKCVDDNGAVIEVDRRENCKAVFPTLDDVHGFFLTFPGTPENLWVEEIQFGRLADGRLTRLGIRASDTGGKSVDMLAPLAQGIPACACVWIHVCDQYNCTGTCGAPPDCPCNDGTGQCASSLKCVCPPDGLCTAPKKCKSKLVDVQPVGDNFQVAAQRATCACQ